MKNTNKQAVEALIRIRNQAKHDAIDIQIAKDCAIQLAPEGSQLKDDLVSWALRRRDTRYLSFTASMIADNSAQLECLVELVAPLSARPYAHDPYFIGLELGTPDAWDLSDESALDQALEYITHDGSYDAYHETIDDERVYQRQGECVYEYTVREIERVHSAEWSGRVSEAFYDALYNLDGYEECRGYEDYKLGTYGGDNATIFAHMVKYLKGKYGEKEFKTACVREDIDLEAIEAFLEEWIN